MITISRIYIVDEDETCIQCQDEDAQAALRAVEAAAERVGARPKPGSFGPAKATRAPRKGKEEPAVTAKPDAAPPLPAGVATVFPASAQAHPGYETTTERAVAVEQARQQTFAGPSQIVPVGSEHVRLSDAPPVPLGQSSVGLAGPPSFGPPPSFEQPPTQEELLRRQIVDQIGTLHTLVPEGHPWRAGPNGVDYTIHGLEQRHGLTAEYLGRLRQYEDALRKTLQ